MRKWLLSILALLLVPATVWAHGTEITYVVDGNTITVTALFDSGEPMAEAQVIIYAPDNPSEAYATVLADENGVATFEVDTARNGTWDIAVRTAGHGEMLHIPVEGDGSIALVDFSGPSVLTRTLQAGAVVAILVGIAFYSSKGQTEYAYR